MTSQGNFPNNLQVGAFISWVEFHGRSEGLARELGISEFSQRGGAGPVWSRYKTLWRQTGEFIHKLQPDAIIVMQPPIVAILACLWHSRKYKTRIAGDLHTGAFDDPKWRWATSLTLRILRGKNLAIVTNHELASVAARHGSRPLVLHDLIEKYPDRSSALLPTHLQGLEQNKFVLVPVTYAYDEPLMALRNAAQETPDIIWVFTGRAPEEFRLNAPENIIFSGFVSREDYLTLLSKSGVVVAATTSENTMQRAGYEALCAGRPLITTSTKVLRDYFGDASLRADATRQGFSEAVVRTLADHDHFADKMLSLRQNKIDEQIIAINTLREWISQEPVDITK